MEAVKPLLKEHGCALPISDKVNLIGDRYYIEATATLFDCESGESYSVTASAREEESKKGMDGSQVTGASSSYARKYALNGLLDIDDTKDSDATNTHGKDDKIDPEQLKADKEAEEVGKEKVTAVAIKALNDLFETTDLKFDPKKYKNTPKIEDLTKDDYFDYVAFLRGELDKKKAKK
jgi:hypothetical protein